MSDNLRRYRAIRVALAPCYPTSSQGTFARHRNTLAALINGIVGSKSSQLPPMATKVPDGTKPESRVTRFTRWLVRDHRVATRGRRRSWCLASLSSSIFL
jgi:hypothetical protein